MYKGRYLLLDSQYHGCVVRQPAARFGGAHVHIRRVTLPNVTAVAS